MTRIVKYGVVYDIVQAVLIHSHDYFYPGKCYQTLYRGNNGRLFFTFGSYRRVIPFLGKWRKIDEPFQIIPCGQQEAADWLEELGISPAQHDLPIPQLA